MDYELGVVAWANSLDYIQTRMALRETAEVHYRRGYKVKLLALTGYELFKQCGVEEFNYEIVDCSQYFVGLSQKYENLKAIFKNDVRGNFFFNNTLRWFVLREFLSGGRVVNVDGDLIINRGAMDHLRLKKCDFFYPDSTCFVVANEAFFESYTDIADRLNANPDDGFEYMRSYARDKNIYNWGLNSLNSLDDLDEEKIAAFAIHRAGLYQFDAATSPLLACPPFIAHAHGRPPFGRYLESFNSRFSNGVFYEYREDTHYFSGFPMCFMHYQEQLHFILGCHKILQNLNAVDDCYRRLLPKNLLINYINSIENGEDDIMRRFIWDVATKKHNFKQDYWDMREIVKNCENGGLTDIFTSRKWHNENIFIS